MKTGVGQAVLGMGGQTYGLWWKKHTFPIVLEKGRESCLMVGKLRESLLIAEVFSRAEWQDHLAGTKGGPDVFKLSAAF